MPRRRHHTAKFRRCVREVEAKSHGMYNPYAVCSASIGRHESVFVRSKHSKKKMPTKAIKAMLKSKKTPPQLKKYWLHKLKKVV